MHSRFRSLITDIYDLSVTIVSVMLAAIITATIAHYMIFLTNPVS